MPVYDFRCRTCHKEFEAYSTALAAGGVATVVCECIGTADVIWRKAPGLRSDEKPPSDELRSAREGLARGVAPFTGETRTELEAWKRDNNLVALSGDEAARGKSSVNTKTKITQTQAFDAMLDEKIAQARELHQHQDGDAYKAARAAIEQPSQYDTDSFAQQAEAGSVASADPSIASAIAAEIQPNA